MTRDEFDNTEIVSIWKTVHKPFLMPAPCSQHSWQLLDADMAGCLRCGTIHECGDNCPVVCENHCNICTITGLCVRNIQFAEDEFVDTMNISDDAESHRNPAIDYDTVWQTVMEIISSEQTRLAFVTERNKTVGKFKTNLLEVLRTLKKKQVDHLPCLLSCITECLNKQKNIRSLFPFPIDIEIETIAGKAADCICNILNFINRTQTRNMSKIRQRPFTIGMLYLMRSGVDQQGVVLIPKIPELTRLLPMESQLAHAFKVRCKTITEVENTIKIIIRNITLKDMIKLGMFQHALRL